MHEANESLRKALHVSFGFGAVALRFLPWQWVAAAAALAVIGNWLLLHRIFGRRVSRAERGWDIGIILYPLAVLAAIVLFRDTPVNAAYVWVILAFGDGLAAVIGRAFPVARLPWNPAKSWGGLFTFLIAGLLSTFAIARLFDAPFSALIIAAVVLAAIAESLPFGVDDNIVVPLVVAVVLMTFARPELPPAAAPPIRWGWLAVNTALALLGYFLGGVDVSGSIAGWFLGDLIILGAGGSLYIALLAFFVIGTLGTRIGYRQKAELGLAEAKGGRRGASHAFANVGVAAVCAIAAWRDLSLLPLLMGVASLATAAADTTGSEIGKLFGHRAFLPLTLRRVERGTEGAISVEGTIAGLIAGFAVAIAGTAATVSRIAPSFAGHIEVDKGRVIATITACAFLGSYLESVVGSWNRKQADPIPRGTMNFLNTATGALLFAAAAHYIPMFEYVF